MPANVLISGLIRSQPEKCWKGYTLYQASIFEGQWIGAVLIDMNGKVVKQWKGLEGFPNKMLPGGFIMGSTRLRDPKISYQDMADLVQMDWDGKIVWKFNHLEYIQDPGQEPAWMARQHHDYQREGNPVGYYVPGMAPLLDSGNTLILTHRDINDSRISPQPLIDDVIVEVDWQGKVVWEWKASDHFVELGFSEAARQALARNPDMVPSGRGDWIHINSISKLGPNQWYEAGDDRFHPDNIIWSSRQTLISGITDRRSGRIVWQIGPDYTASPELKKLGWVIGQHHTHMIPRGLPGEGNILIYDNGGAAGYGAPNPASPDGCNYATRDYSRVIEFNPVTLELVWQYPDLSLPGGAMMAGNRLFSKYISSAQRLPNGNTFVTEGACGRLLEITPGHEIVWEYISPYFSPVMKGNQVYRAYRVPPEWVPQLEMAPAQSLTPVENGRLQLDSLGGLKIV